MPKLVEPPIIRKSLTDYAEINALIKKLNEINIKWGSTMNIPDINQAPITTVPSRLVRDCIWGQPKQTNQLPYHQPACLAHLPPMPLYLMAAHWALHTGELLTSGVVGSVFAVEPRRALAVLRYPTCVVCERLAGKSLRLRIIAVLPGDGRPAALGRGTEVA